MREISRKDLVKAAGGIGEGGCVPKIRWPW